MNVQKTLWLPLALACALAAPAARGTSLTAWDCAADPVYENQWDLGDNGGSGFSSSGWRQTGDSAPMRDIDDLLGEPDEESEEEASGNGEVDFVVGYDGGLGRDLQIPLLSGTFSVDAQHLFSDRFSGFAIYDAGGAEMLRWGVTTEDDDLSGRSDVTGFWFATDSSAGPNAYRLLGEFDPQEDESGHVEELEDLTLTYCLSWQAQNGGYGADLAVMAGGETLAQIVGLNLMGSGGVQTLGVLIAGTSTSDKMAFNHLSVTGESAIPEPGTLALLLAGAFAIAARRRRKS